MRKFAWILIIVTLVLTAYILHLHPYNISLIFVGVVSFVPIVILLMGPRNIPREGFLAYHYSKMRDVATGHSIAASMGQIIMLLIYLYLQTS